MEGNVASRSFQELGTYQKMKNKIESFEFNCARRVDYIDFMDKVGQSQCGLYKQNNGQYGQNCECEQN